jgi:hypothetical protein
MELDTLRDPQRVALQAKRMGMVPPPSPAFIRLGDGQVLGKPLPALGTDAMRVTSRPTVKPKNLTPRPKVITLAKNKSASGASAGTTASTTGTKKNPTR